MVKENHMMERILQETPNDGDVGNNKDKDRGDTKGKANDGVDV